MICFIQIMGSLSQNLSTRPMTINVNQIQRVESYGGKINNASLILSGSLFGSQIYTLYPYEDFIETLSGFQKVEIIEILP